MSADERGGDSGRTPGLCQPWWKDAIAYHVYPRSFQDSDGDGFGDIPGIISRLDHLQDLGVDLVMLGPVYPSPDDDNGYDVADFRDIGRCYGTLDQWRELRTELHRRGMRIMMDLVLNHTSDEHAWFQQAKSCRDSPYRDYYVWRGGDPHSPPNNWRSVFSGSVWEWEPTTQEYYLHLYSRRQPDLNWANPAVRREVADILRFWVKEGVDAFRLDSITTISKPNGLPDAPTVVPGTLQPPHQLIFNGPDILTWLRELQDAKSDHPEVLVVGEGPGVTVEQAVEYVGGPDPALDLILQWEHIDADPGSGGKWDDEWWTPAFFAETMTRWQHGLRGVGWNTLYLGNHDQPRQVSRFGSDSSLWRESATMLATATYLLQGTPFIFQGEEIGMTNVDFERLEDFRDIESLNAAAQWRADGRSEADILGLLRRKSRDNGRTPMQWDASPHAGFTDGTPWIGVNANHSTINVEAQRDDPQSVFSYYRKLFRLRKDLDVVREGTYSRVDSDPDIYAYVRSLGRQRLYVVSNFSDEPRFMDKTPMPGIDHGCVVLANYPDRASTSLELRPFETLVVSADTTDHHSLREVR